MSQALLDCDFRWVVSHSGSSLAEVLAQMGAPPGAVADGRVFVGRTRAGAAELEQVLELGAEVSVYRAREAKALHILGERDEVIAVHKPAGISTQPDHRGVGTCVVGELARMRGESSAALHALHRLDREVSGVVLVACGETGRRWIEEARARNAFRRRYIALGSGSLAPPQGCWSRAIGRGKRPGLRRVGGPEAQEALSRYEVVRQLGATACLLVVEPATGRTHQIRVHAAHAGAPLFGDADYGGTRRAVDAQGAVYPASRIALHAVQVEVATPGGEPWCVSAPIPDDLVQLWQHLGGIESDFAALSTRVWL